MAAFLSDLYLILVYFLKALHKATRDLPQAKKLFIFLFK